MYLVIVTGLGALREDVSHASEADEDKQSKGNNKHLSLSSYLSFLRRQFLFCFGFIGGSIPMWRHRVIDHSLYLKHKPLTPSMHSRIVYFQSIQ